MFGKGDNLCIAFNSIFLEPCDIGKIKQPKLALAALFRTENPIVICIKR